MIDPRCDEVWVIQRSSRDRVKVITSPGTGTIVVVNVNETADAWPTWKRLPAVSTGVHAEITGQLAAVKVEQSFTNLYQRINSNGYYTKSADMVDFN